MTTDEFKKFRRHLFAAFPDLMEWLSANSPDIELSISIWEKSLSDCSLVECMLVLDDWLTGKRPAFKAYERSQVAIMLRQSVQFDRDKERRKQHELSEHDRVKMSSMEYRRTRDRDYKPLSQHLPELRPIFERGAALKRQVMDGKISQAEFERQKALLLEEVL